MTTSTAQAIGRRDIQLGSPTSSGVGVFAASLRRFAAPPTENPGLPVGVISKNSSATTITLVRQRSDWLAGSYAKLIALGKLAADWDGCGAAPPTQLTISCARKVLQLASDFEISPSDIDPSLDGGVSLSFSRREYYGDIEILNSGETLAVVSKGGENTYVWNVENTEWSFSQAIKTIAGFLGRCAN